MAVNSPVGMARVDRSAAWLRGEHAEARTTTARSVFLRASPFRELEVALPSLYFTSADMHFPTRQARYRAYARTENRNSAFRWPRRTKRRPKLNPPRDASLNRELTPPLLARPCPSQRRPSGRTRGRRSACRVTPRGLHGMNNPDVSSLSASVIAFQQATL